MLDRPDIAALLDQMSCEGMAEHVTRDWRIDSGQLASGAYRPLQCVFKNMVAAPQFGFVIPNEFCGAEYVCYAVGIPGIYGKTLPIFIVNFAFAGTLCGLVYLIRRRWGAITSNQAMQRTAPRSDA